jgi:hypothetical protein
MVLVIVMDTGIDGHGHGCEHEHLQIWKKHIFIGYWTALISE